MGEVPLYVRELDERARRVNPDGVSTWIEIQGGTLVPRSGKVYRGSSLIRKRHPHRTTIGP